MGIEFCWEPLILVLLLALLLIKCFRKGRSNETQCNRRLFAVFVAELFFLFVFVLHTFYCAKIHPQNRFQKAYNTECLVAALPGLHTTFVIHTITL